MGLRVAEKAEMMTMVVPPGWLLRIYRFLLSSLRFVGRRGRGVDYGGLLSRFRRRDDDAVEMRCEIDLGDRIAIDCWRNADRGGSLRSRTGWREWE